MLGRGLREFRGVWLLEMVAAALVTLAVAGCGGASVPALRLSVVPRVGLVDRARAITISGLSPGERVTLKAQTTFPGSVFGSRTVFRANRHGRVDLATAAPVSGAYHQPSAMGPFWSASFEHRGGPAFATNSVTRLTAATADGRVSSVTVAQNTLAAGVSAQNETLAAQGFVGAYFTPARLHPHGPSMIVWGGSEGGDEDLFTQAALLASHGIPTLALAYFDEAGLPCSLSNIKIEYFVKAIRWLKQQPGIDPNRVWAWGTSRGSEALGLVASHFPLLLHGIIDASASSVIYPSVRGNCTATTPVAWTLAGKPVASATGSFPVAPRLDSPGTIPFGRYHGAALLVSGSDDGLWPSDGYENVIMRELHADPAAHVHLNYSDAGHADLGPPYQPLQSSTDDHGTRVSFGGTLAGNENAREHDWPAMLRFIKSH
jgi:dienelactone hydrolase